MSTLVNPNRPASFSWGNRSYLEHHIVVHQLNQSDQWQGDGSRKQIRNIWLRVRVPQPAHDVQSLRMEDRGLIGPSVLAQHCSHVLDVILDQSGIGGVDVGKFLKVVLDVALTAKDCEQLGTTRACSFKQGRRRLGVLAREKSVSGAEEDQG